MENAIATQPPLDILGMLSSLGMTRQGEMAIATQLMASAWSVIVTGRILPVIAPLIMRFIVMPFTNMLKAVAKTLIFLGIMGWLLGAVIPIILANFGLVGAGAFIGRAFQGTNFPYTNVDIAGKVGSIGTRGLEYFELDSEVCRRMISCKAGEFVVDNYPSLVHMMRHTGVTNYLTRYSGSGASPYVQEAVAMMAGKRDGTCDEELDPCSGFAQLEAFFDPSKRNMTDFSSFFTTTTVPPVMEASDTVVSFIRNIVSG